MAEYKVDQSACIGCGICPSVAPEHFELVNGVAVVKKQPQAGNEKDLCQQALESCPVSAIKCD